MTRNSKINQKGFAAIDGLLILVIVAIIGGVGWFVWRSRNDTNKTLDSTVQGSSNATASGTKNSAKETVNKKEKAITYSSTIITLKDKIELFKPGDENNLPKGVSASFKTYIRGKLENNSKPDKYGCYSIYYVGRYSDVNISGSTGSVNKNGKTDNNCGGGAVMFWYLKDSKWYGFGTQSILECSFVDKTTLYSEFVNGCWDGTNDVPNPNGSMAKALGKD